MEIRKGGWLHQVLVWGGLPTWYDGITTCYITGFLFATLVKTLVIFFLSAFIFLCVGDLIAWVTFCAWNLTLVLPNGPTVSLLGGLTALTLTVIFYFGYTHTRFWRRLCRVVKIRGEK